jgi:hypothetical protein
MEITESVRTLYPRLADGDIGVLAAFCDKATVDSPLGLKQEPPEFLAETHAWLERHAATVEDVHTVVTPQRVVHEFLLRLDLDGEKRELPVMLVADVADECIRDLRVYHSTWPLYHTHAVRSPIMDYNLTERPPEPVGTYHDALEAGDAVAADAVFEPGGTVREPAGSAYAHSGADRTAWYRTVLSQGTLPLRLGTITDDGETVVYEYMVERWGSDAIPQQVGAAAYQRGASGKLAWARIYDDVEPPASLGDLG